ncbi:Vacuolar protein sorting-associated protein 5 [Komagataella phaffii CBS 7435]|uniref:Nexin-1 homolog required for localizing membrane proteins n=2 Tax=Komagataella phaffii TaxID=460519 RepID=C4R666_KOMPG|nr:uncharacterized protein PAS_chr3_0990 [Komagataella phaffii GS115]AOA63313.1 GQ67_04120T0 [Komagataella phaffii]CAH2449110.1 Vacuolar protein sorting-associated protein 5 [Komagataella phaffii CBS 7435]AOA69257.1 GQ68_04093T0 [Komagataella phaffii GS115]CAY71052.1 Nexin-1 homolog required for localizing membrane proteins [Komagataella phaffii GS115]CCA39152.1 Vacuolar protein sorting-associated protein 5 [Komagataella phaffii CBS 7435]
MNDEPLSGSHWDDNAPSSSIFNVPDEVDPTLNPFKEEDDEVVGALQEVSLESDAETVSKDEERQPNLHEEDLDDNAANSFASGSNNDINTGVSGQDIEPDSQQQQEADIAKEQIKLKKTELLSSLTEGIEKEVKTSNFGPDGNLFGDTNTEELKSAMEASTTSPDRHTFSSSNRKKTVFRPRPRRIGGKVVVPSEPQDDPLNSSKDDDLSNETEANRDAPSVGKLLIESVDEPLFNITKKTIISPTVSPKKERKAAKPTSAIPDSNENMDRFDIVVDDPIKVGELTSAHVVYKIKTRTDSELVASKELSVTRRYRDFLWLYNQLVSNHPGFIIPPPPGKQVVGRFESKFIENRRLGLEKMLVNISRDRSLQKDMDFIIFISSEKFQEESKQREVIHHHNMNSSTAVVSENDTMSSGASLNNSGFMSSISNALSISAPKYVENDKYFIEKANYIEQLDQQLKNLLKTLDLITQQREELVTTIEEFLNTINELIDLEVSNDVSAIFLELHNLQTKSKELLERTNMQEVLTLTTTLDEYVRIIGSIRIVFENRFKVINNLLNLKSQVATKEKKLNKAKTKQHNQVDKIQRYERELSALSNAVDQETAKRDMIVDNVKKQLEIFEDKKVDDFRSMVEIYWESLIETQKEIIELWETFYEKCKFD